MRFLKKKISLKRGFLKEKNSNFKTVAKFEYHNEVEIKIEKEIKTESDHEAETELSISASNDSESKNCFSDIQVVDLPMRGPRRKPIRSDGPSKNIVKN